VRLISKLSLIIEQLRDNITIHTNSSVRNNKVENMEFLEAQSELISSRIYVANPDEARAVLQGIPSIEKDTVLVTGGRAEDSVFEELRNICERHGMVLICTSLSLYAVVNNINGVLFQYQKQAQRFLEASLNCYDIQKLVSIAAELSGCAVFLLSPTFHIMNSAGECSGKKLTTGTLSRETVSKLIPTNRSIYTTHNSGKQGQHFHVYSIMRGDKPMAYLLLIDDEDRALDYEYILKQTAENIIGQLIRAKQTENGRSSDFAILLHDIFEQKIRTAPEIFERLEALPYPPRQRRRMGLIMFEDREQAIPFDFIIAQLREVFPEYNMAVYKGEIVILICEQDRIFNVELDEQRINEIMAPYNGYMCIGHSTSDLTKARTQYLLTRHALIVAKKLRLKRDANTRVFRYEQYTNYVLIDMFAHRFQEIHGNNDILYLGHPAIVKITRFDRQHNNNLRDVLYYYLLNDRNLVKTAEAMHMHRNTVFYKINQIKELIGMDLEDGRLQQDFLLSCQIIRYFEDYMGESVRSD